MNLKIILLLIHCLVDMPTSQARLSYLAMSERYRIVRVMVSKDRWANSTWLYCGSPIFGQGYYNSILWR